MTVPTALSPGHPATDSSVIPHPNSAVTGTDWLLWQLVDSAFPTGGFAHSGGLEAALQHGEVTSRASLRAFLENALIQAGRGALPFVLAAHRAPGALDHLDLQNHAFLSNHVANRASRLQGRALFSAVRRIFSEPPASPLPGTLPAGAGGPWATPPPSHVAPAFGHVFGRLGIPADTTARAFLFNHLRSLLAAAVRLNLVGPMEAQALQFQLSEAAERARARFADLKPDDASQPAPLVELFQGAHERLYSRLFQS